MLMRFPAVFLCLLISFFGYAKSQQSDDEPPLMEDTTSGNWGQEESASAAPPPTQQAQPATPAPAPHVQVGCSEQDQQSCDDVCKGDSFWYGYCASWDGRDLQCSCIGYKQPLDGPSVCGPERQEKCAAECRQKGQEAGGYCAVFPSAEDSRGQPKCMCFDKPAIAANK